jgi:hypothetical protein
VRERINRLKGINKEREYEGKKGRLKVWNEL